jgi:hypothetical protein
MWGQLAVGIPALITALVGAGAFLENRARTRDQAMTEKQVAFEEKNSQDHIAVRALLTTLIDQARTFSAGQQYLTEKVDGVVEDVTDIKGVIMTHDDQIGHLREVVGE